MTARVSCLLALAVVAAAAAGCGSGSSTTLGAPLVDDGSLSAGGEPLGNSGPPGTQVRFIERSTFGIGLVLHNESGKTMKVVDARVVAPEDSLVQQIGVRLLSWNPKPCPPHVMGCLISIFLRSPYRAGGSAPVEVVPGKGVAVQLNFRVGSCADLPNASFAPAHTLDIAYRQDGGTHTEKLELGSARLLLQKPPAGICSPRPYSRLAIDGPFASSTAATIPSGNHVTCARTPSESLRCAGDDRCTRTAAGAIFRSGLYETGDKPAVRIEIRLDAGTAIGGYGVAMQAQVLVIVGIGDRGWTTYRARAGTVTVTRAAAGTLEGHLQVTALGFRKRPFHAFGSWGCTI